MQGFITLEGVEGAGKSTLRTKLVDYLRSIGKEVVATREPGATELGRTFRNILLSPESKNMAPITELMLFAADRAQHVAEVIRPALERGAVVLCDRFTHSTLAYQGYGRGLDLDLLRQINLLVTDGIQPGLVLLLDLDPKAGLERVHSRSEKASGTYRLDELPKGAPPEVSLPDRMERQSLEFHQRIRNGFLEMAKAADSNFVILEAALSKEQVVKQALVAVKQHLNLNR